ncbi:lytic transglycosylase domain-containing protein [Roseicitreum antarcticum]
MGAAVLMIATIAASPAPSQTPPGHEDFTFRRIAPGTSSGGPRITVQIDPAEQARRLAAAPRVPAPQVAPTTPGAATTTGAHGWFWNVVSPDITQGAGRFAQAVNAVGNAPPGSGLTAPRMQFMQDIAQAHGAQILRATIGTQVSPALVLAIIAVESAGQPRAVSSAGAQGLMQLIPATAARFGVSDSFDPTQNIGGGVQYLDWLMTHFDRDAVLAVAAYNAGEGAVRRNNGVPPFAETRDYVPKVLAAWAVARGLCVTPPELPSDGCVFKVGQSG